MINMEGCSEMNIRSWTDTQTALCCPCDTKNKELLSIMNRILEAPHTVHSRGVAEMIRMCLDVVSIIDGALHEAHQSGARTVAPHLVIGHGRVVGMCQR